MKQAEEQAGVGRAQAITEWKYILDWRVVSRILIG
jgi:methionine-rich copper-binding protein CopC